jgi:aryl-alcohol dehydrogenase-like predicted oxidoreductase
LYSIASYIQCNDFRRNAPRFAGDALEANLARLDALRDIADQREATRSQVALAWVLFKGVFAIPGTKRLSYLEQNIAAASLYLSADEIGRLDHADAPGSFTGDRYTAEGMKGVSA